MKKEFIIQLIFVGRYNKYNYTII